MHSDQIYLTDRRNNEENYNSFDHYTKLIHRIYQSLKFLKIKIELCFLLRLVTYKRTLTQVKRLHFIF